MNNQQCTTNDVQQRLSSPNVEKWRDEIISLVFRISQNCTLSLFSFEEMIQK